MALIVLRSKEDRCVQKGGFLPHRQNNRKPAHRRLSLSAVLAPKEIDRLVVLVFGRRLPEVANALWNTIRTTKRESGEQT